MNKVIVTDFYKKSKEESMDYYKRMSALITELQKMLDENKNCWSIHIDDMPRFTHVQIDRKELNAVEAAAGDIASRKVFSEDNDELYVDVDGVRYMTLEGVDRNGR